MTHGTTNQMKRLQSDLRPSLYIVAMASTAGNPAQSRVRLIHWSCQANSEPSNAIHLGALDSRARNGASRDRRVG